MSRPYTVLEPEMDEDGEKALRAVLGKHIAQAISDSTNDELRMWFADGSGIVIRDEGQDCCETRYLTTDDRPGDFIGATLIGLEVRDAPNRDSGGDIHEVQFLLVHTSRGTFTLETHNEHNGYYGGFRVVVRPLAMAEVTTITDAERRFLPGPDQD